MTTATKMYIVFYLSILIANIYYAADKYIAGLVWAVIAIVALSLQETNK